MIIYLATRLFAALYCYAWPLENERLHGFVMFMSCCEFVFAALVAVVRIAVEIDRRIGGAS